MAAIEDQTKAIAAHLEQMYRSSRHIEGLWGSVAEHVEDTRQGLREIINAVAPKFSSIFERSYQWGLKFMMGTRQHKEEWDRLRQKMELGQAIAAFMETSAVTATGKHKTMLEAVAKSNRAGVLMTKEKLAINELVSKQISIQGAVQAVAVAATALTVKSLHEMNEQLKQAVVHVRQRTQLMSDIYAVQQATGNETTHMLEATKALVNQGFDLRDNFQDTLKAAVMLEESIGLSYQTSAELAVTFRALGTSLDKIGDVLARVVTDTGLAADEAARYAQNIAKAMLTLRPGIAHGAEQVVALTERFEAAMKEMTGVSGGVTEALVRMTRPEGMAAGGMTGFTPDMLKSAEGVKQAIENMGGFIEQTLGDTFGWDRMLRIDMLKRIYGLSEIEINNFSAAMKQMGQQVDSATTLQTVFNKQTTDLAKSFNRVYNSIDALVKGAMTPFVRANILAQLTGTVTSFQPMIKALSITIPLAAIAAIMSLTRLAQQMRALAIATYKYNLAKMAEKNIIVENVAAGGLFTGLIGKAGLIGVVLTAIAELYNVADLLSGGALTDFWSEQFDKLGEILKPKAATTAAQIGTPGLRSAAEQMAEFQRYMSTGRHSAEEMKDYLSDLVAHTEEVVTGATDREHRMAAIRDMYYWAAQDLAEVQRHHALAGTTWDSGKAIQEEIAALSGNLETVMAGTVDKVLSAVDDYIENNKALREAKEARDRVRQQPPAPTGPGLKMGLGGMTIGR
jgi:hypothetical protein